MIGENANLFQMAFSKAGDGSTRYEILKVQQFMIGNVFIYKNQHLIFKMSVKISCGDIWQEFIQYNRDRPLNFEKLENQYDIKKLDLRKITVQEIRSKRILFQNRPVVDDEAAKTWMENQYRIFMWFVLTYFQYVKKNPEKLTQTDWGFIASIFQKYSYVCQYFFYSCCKKKSVTWSPEQDEIITMLMRSSLSKKWTSIGLELFRLTQCKSVKKPKSIRERWLSHLNPEIKRDGWTVDEQLELLQKMREYGKKWSKIASVLGNRSEHTIKNRYNKLKTKLIAKDQYLKQQDSQQILNLLFKGLTKKQDQTRKTKKNQIPDHPLQLPQLPSSQQKIQPDQMTQSHLHPSTTIPTIKNIDMSMNTDVNVNLKSNYIFNPIIITFGGFNLE